MNDDVVRAIYVTIIVVVPALLFCIVCAFDMFSRKQLSTHTCPRCTMSGNMRPLISLYLITRPACLYFCGSCWKFSELWPKVFVRSRGGDDV